MNIKNLIIYIDSSQKNKYIFENFYLNGLVKIKNDISIIDYNINLIKQIYSYSIDIKIFCEKQYIKILKRTLKNKNINFIDINKNVSLNLNEFVFVIKDNVVLNEKDLENINKKLNIKNIFFNSKNSKNKIFKDACLLKEINIKNKIFKFNSLFSKTNLDNSCVLKTNFFKIDNYNKLLEVNSSYNDNLLMLTPGPLYINPYIASILQYPIHHRSFQAKKIFNDLANNIKYAFGSKNGFPVAMLSTGFGCIESCFANLTIPHDKALILNNGFFGENLIKNAKHYQLDYQEIKAEFGKSFVLSEVKEKLENKKICFMVHHETSTGVVNDVESIGKICQQKNVLLVVDAVSSLINHDFKFDDWNVAAAVGTSTKGFETSPSLSFLCVSKKALLVSEEVNKLFNRTIYFDWNTYRLKHLYNGLTPSTYPLNVMASVNESIKKIKSAGGIKKFGNLKKNIVEKWYKKLTEIGFERIPNKEFSSNWIVVVKTPKNISAKQLRAHLYINHNVLIEIGILDASDTILRIGFPSYFDQKKLDDVLKNIINYTKDLN